jgi:8-oxo-dGTP diphosphatase
MINVVCAIIHKRDKIFICRRKLEKTNGGLWEFPGGKIEDGESELGALKRELKEELNMEIEVLNSLGTFIFDYPSFSVNLSGFECKLLSWDKILVDHDKFEWIKIEEINNYDFSEADKPFINLLINKIR